MPSDVEVVRMTGEASSSHRSRIFGTVGVLSMHRTVLTDRGERRRTRRESRRPATSVAEDVTVTPTMCDFVPCLFCMKTAGAIESGRAAPNEQISRPRIFQSQDTTLDALALLSEPFSRDRDEARAASA